MSAEHPTDAVELEVVDVDTLNPWPDNPRLNEAAVERVMASLERFGFQAPILARRSDRVVIAGHTRLEAAKRSGRDRVTVVWSDLSDREARLYALADNRLGEHAEWDMDRQRLVVEELKGELADDTIGALEVAGFDDGEIGRLVDIPQGDGIKVVANIPTGEGITNVPMGPGDAVITVSVPKARAAETIEAIRAALAGHDDVEITIS